jgi:hypothetical protein
MEADSSDDDDDLLGLSTENKKIASLRATSSFMNLNLSGRAKGGR